MADHYRILAQSLVEIGFLFRRQAEGRREVWRNRQTAQDVTFDRDEVAKSRAAADDVLAVAQALLRDRKAVKPEADGNAAPSPRRRSAAKSRTKPPGKSSAKSAPSTAKPARSMPKRSSLRRPTGAPSKGTKGAGKRK